MNALLKKLGMGLLCLMGFNSLSQSILPPCQGMDVSKWNNCLGTQNFEDGSNYFGEFQSGKSQGLGTMTFSNGTQYVGSYLDDRRNGHGIEYDVNGNVTRAGYWRNSQLISVVNIDQKLFPFNASRVSRLTAVDSSKINSDTSTFPPLQPTPLEHNQLSAELDKNKRQELEPLNQLATPNPFNVQTASAAQTGTRLALVIGNNNYKSKPLKNSRNDADDISRSLKKSGFSVIDLRDATLPQMRTAVRQFGDRLLKSNVGLVYYSGHGVEVKGRNYFIPVNADIQREDEISDQGLDVSLVLEKMSTAGNGVNILIVDACRDDPFGRSFRSSSKGLASMDAPRGTIIAYSTSPGKVAFDGDPKDRNSPYTKHLVKAMQSPNKPIEQVFKEVRRAVQNETKDQQTPWENTSLSGDFYFNTQK